jgi:uncharacterized protein
MPRPEFTAYVILLTKLRPFTPAAIRAHVEHIRRLDERGELIVCGPFLDAAGGLVVFRASSVDAARAIAEADPFVVQGFESYELRTLEIGCKENRYLLG